MITDRTILITGVTGQSGRARFAQALQGSGFPSARPDAQARRGERAGGAWARHGRRRRQGAIFSMTKATLRRALAGEWGRLRRAEHGGGGCRAGKRRRASVSRRWAAPRPASKHYVYTSVGSAPKRTGVPHFDNKVAHRGNRGAGLHFPVAC